MNNNNNSHSNIIRFWLRISYSSISSTTICSSIIKTNSININNNNNNRNYNSNSNNNSNINRNRILNRIELENVIVFVIVIEM